MFEVWFLKVPIISGWTNDRVTQYKTQLSDSNSVTLMLTRTQEVLPLPSQNSYLALELQSSVVKSTDFDITHACFELMDLLPASYVDTISFRIKSKFLFLKQDLAILTPNC